MTLHALARKLLRGLWHLRGQVLAIAAIVASAVGVMVMYLTALGSLERTASAYYQRYRFAEVFAGLERAPEQLAALIAEIPGVQTVETRVTSLALLDLEQFREPAVGQLISIPEQGEPLLNRLALRVGRSVQPGRPDEVVLSEPFADAHGLGLGDQLAVVMNGHRRDLEVVGIALSPEFVYAIGPGALVPDDERYGVGWMGRTALKAAYDFEGAFNDVSLALLRGV